MIKWREYRSFYYNVDDDNIFCRSLLLLNIRLFFSYKAVHPYQTDIRLHLRQYYLLVITASSSPARPSHFFWQHTHTISPYFLLTRYQACHGRVWSFQSVFFCFILPRNMNGYLALYVNIWIKTMSLNWVESLAQARFKFIYTNYSNTLESAGHFYDATRLNRVSRTCSWLVRTCLCLYTTSQR